MRLPDKTERLVTPPTRRECPILLVFLLADMCANNLFLKLKPLWRPASEFESFRPTTWSLCNLCLPNETVLRTGNGREMLISVCPLVRALI